jgi:PAS domain S-box-containing protein
MRFYKRFLLLPLIIVVFSYLLYASYKEVKDRTLDEFNHQQFALAKQASKGIESFFAYYQRELQFLTSLNYVSELNNQGRNLLEDFYKSHSDQIEAITLVNEAGILIYTFPYSKNAIGNDISSQEHIKTVLNTHKITVSEVFTSIQGYRTIALHVPIINGTEYKGSLAILIPLNALGQQFIQSINTGVTGYGWMISKDGVALYSPFPDQIGKSAKDLYNGNPSVLSLIDKASEEESGTSICYLSSKPDNAKGLTKTLTAYYRVSLGNTFWTIIIFTPEIEIFRTLASFRNRLFILFSLIISLIITYFFLSFRASSILLKEKKRRSLEKVLSESEKRFRIMFELSPSGIILLDEVGTIIEVNTSFSENLGYSKSELIGNNVRFFSAPDNEGDVERNIAKILSGKTLKHEVRSFRKDGTACTVALYETLILLPDGKRGILSVSNDITVRKRVTEELISAKEKAEESDRLKSAFLTNMSHELRTPLNAIIGFSNLMIAADPENETTSYLRIIANSGQHLLGLVEDILDISMIEREEIKINYEKVGINSILYDVKNIIKGEILKENKDEIQLILNINPNISDIFIFTDSRRLKQVLINLLKNSLKFTDKGYIEFGFTVIKKDEADYFKFYVIDTGIGIEKKYHEIIFNNFRQIDDTNTRKYGGTGIGLSIARKIIEKLGGEIWVESEPGEGSVFYFTIPVLSEKRNPANLPIETAMITENDYKGKTILIAEDEVTSFEFLRIYFTKMNIRVLWAKNGREAIDICEADPLINMVLMDIKMPLLNGYESTRKIKKMLPGMPIIAQTAHAMQSEKEEALNSGCDDYLSKPIEMALLKDMLKKYLR